ncbi:glycosyltransferase [Alkaliphilus hydrothermalis]|uniref:Cellulose synthase/poly-beta-1,6-N-acetylglucosamine synthase-like glycosyltransferase n=1 Tax=Alkaliphilus hydrothermalis TaxID=1482730 RepID=A0ABS2NTD2_9FIRM|nr:glycosyltransferase family 2 protein [Alkaliphilus hydrothermalis]MBM7616210.1 cellulose synthase/poly-beta-1,6-N-acetylglucosamine synthase-like glycosyltransferase [Alkaliphilus hydrothermalis]
MNNMTKVSIAIPAKNSGRTVEKTLKSLINLNYPKELLEVIIGDNGSTDNTQNIILEYEKKHPNLIKYLDASDCPGGGKTREKLVDHCSGEIVVCTDADIVAHPDWIKELVKPFAMDPQIGCVGGEILSQVLDENNLVEQYCKQRDLLKVSKRRRIKTEGYIRGFRDLAPSDIVGWYTPFFATANCAYRKDVIYEVGNDWDDNNDDEHFGFKVALKGYKQYFTSAAIIYHLHRNSVEGLKKQLHYYGYNHPKLIQQFSKNKFEILLGMDRYKCNYIKIPFFKPVVIFIGWFNFMLLSILTSFLASINVLNHNILPISLIFSLFSAVKFFQPCFKLKPFNKIFYWMYLRFIINWYYLIGVIKGSFKFKRICIEEPNY